MIEPVGESAQDGFPFWAVVSPKRAEHVVRVVELLKGWADATRLGARERARFSRVGWLHDALRDADEDELRRWAPEAAGTVAMLHGPAAAARAELEGETDQDILSAVRWHTVGWAGWGALGRALYCADFLEPGRPFSRPERSELARRYPEDPSGVLREVIRMRIEHAEQKGRELYPETVAFVEACG